MPPSNPTGGDLVDQLREWLERTREQVGARLGGGSGARSGVGRSGRRVLRSQAVPLGSYRADSGAGARPGDRRVGTAGRGERAERGAYTLVFAAVLVTLVLGLLLALNWALGSSAPARSAPAAPATPVSSPGQIGAPIMNPPPAANPSPSPSPEPSPVASPGTGRVHVVEAGDTLNRIAQRYGVTVDAIMRANNRTDRNQILRIGERLVIPDGAGAAPIPR
jgi:hypothetical protein